MEAIFAPVSIAVLGASETAGQRVTKQQFHWAEQQDENRKWRDN
jgi:hypothetical protein